MVPFSTWVEFTHVLLREDLSEYNKEDGQLRWLEDHGYEVHLAQFWSIIPRKIREEMTLWKHINLTFEEAK